MSTKAYAIAHMRSVHWCPDIIDYVVRISDTLSPYGGKFLVHGNLPVVMDGEFKRTVVVIEFPSMDKARAWYFSDEYQAIVRLRTGNSDGAAFLISGVLEGYRANELLRKY